MVFFTPVRTREGEPIIRTSYISPDGAQDQVLPKWMSLEEAYKVIQRIQKAIEVLNGNKAQ